MRRITPAMMNRAQQQLAREAKLKDGKKTKSAHWIGAPVGPKFMAWLDENFPADPHEMTSATTVYMAWNEHAVANGMPFSTHKSLGRAMRAADYRFTRRRSGMMIVGRRDPKTERAKQPWAD